MAARTPPVAPGLRAMPSQAAAAILPWPSPPPNAATATPKPTARTSVVVFIGALSAGAVPCANAAGATNITTNSNMHTAATFFISTASFVNCRQEVVPGHRAAGLTLTATNSKTLRLVLVGGGQANVNGRQNREDVRLHDRHENVQQNKRDRHKCRQDSQCDSECWVLSRYRERGCDEEADEQAINQIAGKNVGPQTGRQRKQTRASAENLDRENQWHQPP